MFRLLRPLLFRLPPEAAHRWTLLALRAAGATAPTRRALEIAFGPPIHDPVHVFGLRFPNRVGLAAGYDKDATGWRGLGALGFGHLELGTVTPAPQSGNPRPRVFRLPRDWALVNRLGFPSRGIDSFLGRLPSGLPERPLLGVNLGKQRDTPLERALDDYVGLFRRVADRVHFVTVNVSSPNTPGLRTLQRREALAGLVSALVAIRDERIHTRRIPLLVKLSPDLDDDDLDGAIDVLGAAGIDGIVATNTTRSRNGVTSPRGREEGGLSGAPLESRSTAVIERIARRTEGRLPIVGVGGILDAHAARRKIDAGATLVQLYTGLVYRGPGLVREIAAALARTPP